MAVKATLHPNEKTRLGGRARQIQLAGSAVGMISLVLAVILGLMQGDGMGRFFHSYLIGYTFWLSLSCGALWLVLLHHLVQARWSVTIRRTAELLTAPFGVMLVLALVIILPMWLGNDSLYVWSNHEIAHSDHLIHMKSSWLNAGFFGVRIIAYLAIMTGMAWWFRSRSIEQDAGGKDHLTTTMRRVSAPAMIVFALTLAFIAFDLLMSLEPRWFSTMYGVYYFAGSGIAVMAALALVSMLWQRLGVARRSITVEHYHELGKFLFAFVFFWGYIAFCQFMLIWYANIPEETAFFRHRIFGDYQIVAIVMLVLHLAIPFVFLLSRETKRRLPVLAGFAAWMLVMHWLDLYWNVMPAFEMRAGLLDNGDLTFHLIELAATIGIGGLFVAAVAHAAGKVHIIPIKDPRLEESLGFENM
jgi:hypothetical protein